MVHHAALAVATCACAALCTTEAVPRAGEQCSEGRLPEQSLLLDLLLPHVAAAAPDSWLRFAASSRPQGAPCAMAAICSSLQLSYSGMAHQDGMARAVRSAVTSAWECNEEERQTGIQRPVMSHGCVQSHCKKGDAAGRGAEGIPGDIEDVQCGQPNCSGKQDRL